jgi:hypothetical protein
MLQCCHSQCLQLESIPPGPYPVYNDITHYEPIEEIMT